MHCNCYLLYILHLLCLCILLLVNKKHACRFVTVYFNKVVCDLLFSEFSCGQTTNLLTDRGDIELRLSIEVEARDSSSK